MDFAIGGLAAMGASLFSNPFDVIKTRMQLQGELKARGQHAIHYQNVVHAAYAIAKHEGLRGLQKGLGIALIMHSVRNSVRLGSYQWLNAKGFITNSEGKTILYRSLLAGSISGAAGAFCGSPLFLIKTQLQSQAAENIAVGHQHKHTGAFHALRGIYLQNGIQGLWRGVNGTMLRAVVGSSSQLTSFVVTKDCLRDWKRLEKSPLLISLTASLVSGIFQTIMITPFDIVSTRLYNQATDSTGKGVLYSGICDCFYKIWKTEGPFGFYKGIAANYMRLGPHGALCLVFWDILINAQQKYLK